MSLACNSDTKRNFRLLHTVLKMHEAATSAFCSQDQGLASHLALKNGSKTMHLYQRFAVKWMVDGYSTACEKEK